jgi:hypothetical protein
MTGVINGDGGPVDSFFGLDASGYYTTRAGGSQGASGPAADDVPGIAVTNPSGVWYGRPVTASHGTTEPGQDDTNTLCPGPADGYVSTGAGAGGTDPWGRHAWQQGAS